jgi:anti-sigma-K factor RskA
LNIETYIASGILEAYLLGEVTADERTEVERLAAVYPELKAELTRIERTLEALAMKGAVTPREGVKNKIISQITETEGKQAMVIPMTVSYWRYAAAAAIVIALVSSFLAYSYRSRWVESQTALDRLIAQNQQVADNYNVVNQKLDKLQSDVAIMENTAFRKVVMKGTANDLTAQASVYWNEKTNEAYISIQNLKELTKEHQYQLWAIVKGQPVDVGVFDRNFNGLLKMKGISGAAAFAVTIEPRGGRTSPTLETMQVIGAVDRRAG